jgi:hypothetical protein
MGGDREREREREREIERRLISDEEATVAPGGHFSSKQHRENRAGDC